MNLTVKTGKGIGSAHLWLIVWTGPYLKTVGSQIKAEGFLKVEQAILRFLAQNIKR